MGCFKDTKGRSWSVEINVGTEMRLEEAGINFYEFAENKGAKLFELEHKNAAFAKVLYVIVDAAKSGVDAVDFFCSLEGEQLEQAFELFLNAYANFSRDKVIRFGIQTFQDRRAKLKEVGMREAKKLAATMTDEAIEQFVSQAMKSAESSGVLQAS